MSATSRRAVISGRVQGVGFRVWTLKTAGQLGLTGWVRNLPNGDVETLLQGSDSVVAKMIELLHEGPLYSEVTSVTVSVPESDEQCEEFEIR